MNNLCHKVFPFNYFLVLVFIILFMTACGGGKSSSTSPSTLSSPVNISGEIIGDAAADWDVTIQNLAGKALGTAVSNDDGGFSIKVDKVDISDGFNVVAKGGKIAGKSFTEILRASYSSTQLSNANVTLVTTLIDALAENKTGASQLEKRDIAIQELAKLGMVTNGNWNLLKSEYFDHGALGFRVADEKGISGWLEAIKEDIADGELSIGESRSLFPKAHSGIETVQISLDRSASLLPGEKATATFDVQPKTEDQQLIIKLIQAPSWVTITNQQLNIEPPIGEKVGERLIVVEVALDTEVTGRKVSITANILKRLTLLSGQLGAAGGKIENEWRDISVSVPESALLQSYDISYYLAYDNQGELSFSWDISPEMSTSEQKKVQVIQPTIDILKSRYIHDQNKQQRTLKSNGNFASKAYDPLPSFPINLSDGVCKKEWKIHARDGYTRTVWNNLTAGGKADADGNKDGFQFSYVWQSTDGFFSEDEPGPSAFGVLSRPRILPSKQFKFKHEIVQNCTSMLLSESKTIDNNSIPVLLVHGYAAGLMGEVDAYFGHLPKLLKNKGYQPFIFSWHTNSRFEDSANELGEAIKKINELTGKQVHIVAHSFGGLLTRTLLQGLAEKVVFQDKRLMVKNNEFTKKFMEDRIASVITLGTPHSGIFKTKTVVEFDTSTKDKEPITFYPGRDDFSGYAIELSASLTTHEAGEDYWMLGGNGSALDKLEDFGVANEPGQVVYNLAESFWRTYPDVPTKVLLGVKPDGVSCANVLSNLNKCEIEYSIEKSTGDGLISLKGQRFLPSSNGMAKNTLSLNNIKEHLLGFSTGNFQVGKNDYYLPKIYAAMDNDDYIRDGIFRPNVVLTYPHDKYSSVIYEHLRDYGDLNKVIYKSNGSEEKGYNTPILTEAGLQSCNPDNPDACQHATWKYLVHMVETYPAKDVNPLQKINVHGKVVYKDANGLTQVVSAPAEVYISVGEMSIASSTTDSDGNFSFDVEFKPEESYELSVIPPQSAQSRGVSVRKTTAKTLGSSSLDFSEVWLFNKSFSSGSLTVQLKDATSGALLTDYQLIVKTTSLPANKLIDKQVSEASDAIVSLPQGHYEIEILKAGYAAISSSSCTLSFASTCSVTMLKETPILLVTINSITPTNTNIYPLITQDFIVTGTNLTDSISMTLADCPSPALQAGGTSTRRVFQCTPQSVGTKSGKVTDGTKSLDFTVVVKATPDSASTGSILSPIDGATETTQSFQIMLNATDTDGIKKASLIFKEGGTSFTVCEDGTATPCNGNTINKTVTVNPADYGATSRQIPIVLWVKDEKDRVKQVDNIGITWTPTPVTTITSVTPSTSSVYATVAQKFIVIGTNLTDSITMTLADCPSAVLESGGTATRRIFQCTPQSTGSKSGAITDNGKTFNFTVNVTTKPDSASTGSITSPAEGSTHTSDTIQISVTATDSDGLKKVALVFKEGGTSFTVCEDGTAIPCDGNTINKTVTVNPGDYGAEDGQVTIGLWVKDETTQDASPVDNVGITWTPTPVVTITSVTPDTDHVYATIAQNFVVAGTNLTDNISMTLADCPSAVLQTGGTATQRIFQCVPLTVGTKSGTIADGTVSHDFSVTVETKPVFAAIGAITTPTAASTHNTQTIQFSLNAEDQDGLKKVTLVFKENTAGYIVCENGTATPCDGNTITKTITVDPSSYGATAGAVEVGLWVHDDNAQDYQVTRVDSVAITWNPPATISAPQNVQVTAGDAQATLTWDDVVGAVSYDVCTATETITVPVNCATHQGGQLHLNKTSPVVLGSLTNGTEYFYVVIAKDANGVEVASAVVSGTPANIVQPTPTGKLNDTGITLCGDYAYGGSGNHNNNLDCNGVDLDGDPIPPGQDALYGRDASHNDDSDGHAGFSFTKIGSSGQALPASATEWSCVKDNVTGLIWEVKTDDGGLHDKRHTYTWYNPNSNTNGRRAGYENGDYDTDSFVSAVNKTGYCGATDWRMPTREELRSIIDYSIAYPGLSIDTNYFINTTGYTEFWSSSPWIGVINEALSVDFIGCIDKTTNKGLGRQVRLVRSGQ